MSKPSKATQAQATARKEELVRILLAGAQAIDIREYVREKAADADSVWHVPDDGKPLSDKQIEGYTTQARKLIAASTQETRRGRIRRHLAQRASLYAQAVAAGDYKAALACLDSEARLLALHRGKGAAKPPKQAPGPKLADFTRKRSSS